MMSWICLHHGSCGYDVHWCDDEHVDWLMLSVWNMWSAPLSLHFQTSFLRMRAAPDCFRPLLSACNRPAVRHSDVERLVLRYNVCSGGVLDRPQIRLSGSVSSAVWNVLSSMRHWNVSVQSDVHLTVHGSCNGNLPGLDIFMTYDSILFDIFTLRYMTSRQDVTVC